MSRNTVSALIKGFDYKEEERIEEYAKNPEKITPTDFYVACEWFKEFGPKPRLGYRSKDVTDYRALYLSNRPEDIKTIRAWFARYYGIAEKSPEGVFLLAQAYMYQFTDNYTEPRLSEADKLKKAEKSLEKLEGDYQIILGKKEKQKIKKREKELLFNEIVTLKEHLEGHIKSLNEVIQVCCNHIDFLEPKLEETVNSNTLLEKLNTEQSLKIEELEKECHDLGLQLLQYRLTLIPMKAEAENNNKRRDSDDEDFEAPKQAERLHTSDELWILDQLKNLKENIMNDVIESANSIRALKIQEDTNSLNLFKEEINELLNNKLHIVEAQFNSKLEQATERLTEFNLKLQSFKSALPEEEDKINHEEKSFVPMDIKNSLIEFKQRLRMNEINHEIEFRYLRETLFKDTKEERKPLKSTGTEIKYDIVDEILAAKITHYLDSKRFEDLLEPKINFSIDTKFRQSNWVKDLLDDIINTKIEKVFLQYPKANKILGAETVKQRRAMKAPKFIETINTPSVTQSQNSFTHQFVNNWNTFATQLANKKSTTVEHLLNDDIDEQEMNRTVFELRCGVKDYLSTTQSKPYTGKMQSGEWSYQKRINVMFNMQKMIK